MARGKGEFYFWFLRQQQAQEFSPSGNRTKRSAARRNQDATKTQPRRNKEPAATQTSGKLKPLAASQHSIIGILFRL